MNDKINGDLKIADALDGLRTFRAQNGLALSIYLDLRPTQWRERAMDTIRVAVHSRLRDMGLHEEAWQALQEDLDLIQIYLGTNNRPPAAGVAIFSCAQELFWRVYPLSTPVEAEVHVGSKLETRQLLAALESTRERNVA